MVNLENKVALITGASSGIGAATAEYFASLKCSLVLVARNVEKMESVRKRCIQAGLPDTRIMISITDVTDDNALKSMVEQAMKKFGTLDILVNNAGTTYYGNVNDSSMASYDFIMNLNLRSIVSLVKLCMPYLKASKGSVVNISSIRGLNVNPIESYYCVSKAAVDHLTKCLALELAPFGVRVNSINPGFIPTDICMNAGMTKENFVKEIEKQKKNHALGRVGEPLEVAKAVAFLASDDASFITGAVLPVDGGRLLIST